MFSQILVPLDGSELSERALSHAKDIAKSGGATVHLVRVLTRHPAADARPFGSGLDADYALAQTAEMARALNQAELESVQAYLDGHSRALEGEGIAVQTDIHEGSPEDHIVGYAQDNDVDLIVMSTAGHGGIRRLVLGSTTDRVIRSCEVPVLVVPCG